MKELQAIKLVYKDGTEREIQNNEHIIVVRFDDGGGFYSQNAPDKIEFCNLIGNIIKHTIQENKHKKDSILSLMLVVLSQLR